MERTQKKEVLLEQISAMSSLVHVGDKKYESYTIVRAFVYFATSCALYKRLREDFELPGITTLTRLTSKVNKIDVSRGGGGGGETIFNVSCTVFGKAVNKPNELANTVLVFYIITFYGAPKFLLRMLPVSGLDTIFLFGETQKIIVCKGCRWEYIFHYL